jgi:hypothetical protein
MLLGAAHPLDHGFVDLLSALVSRTRLQSLRAPHCLRTCFGVQVFEPLVLWQSVQ